MTHPLTDANWGIPPIVNYKGVLVEKIIGGYKVLNTITNLEEGVDRIIEQAGKHLSRSIVNEGSFNCTNDKTETL